MSKSTNLNDAPFSEATSTASNPKQELTLKVILAAMVSFLTSSFPSGFNIGFVNTPEAVFKRFFNHSLNDIANGGIMADENRIALWWSTAVSILLVGAFVGNVFAGHLADSIGRRGLLLVNALICLVGLLLCFVSKYLQSVVVFFAGRLIMGLHLGIGSSLVPMYLIEIAPKRMATYFGPFYVIGLNSGLMIGQIVGLDSVFGTDHLWQLMFLFSGAIILLGLSFIWLCPESPVYLFVMKQQEQKAIDVLKSIRGQTVEQLSDDIAILRQELNNKRTSNRSLMQMFRHDKSFKRNLLVVCVLHAGQQLIGQAAIFFYSTKTFQDVGMSPSVSQYATIGCSTLNVLSVIVCLPILRRFESRNLLLVSTGTIATCLLILTLSMTFVVHYQWLNYVTIGIILVYVFSLAVGIVPIPFMIGSELFEKSSMAIGMSIGCLVNWFCCFLVSMTFPIIALAINQYAFLVFLSFNILLLSFIYFKIPETRKIENGNF